ncbi:uncharacterized protein LOC143885134 [Tasmannia lanceolata]|uniref:uncharacterized protein LOC143885134 n=1 Tax=Tasmannia lanceolata TaxID=3420 RepID=UPI0040644823
MSGKISSQKPSPASSSHRKTRWESGNPPSDPKPCNNKPSSSLPSDPTPLLPLPKSESRSGSRSGPPAHFLLPDPTAPPPPQPYGFHMLDRRTIVLADGSVRSYFALPPDYSDPPPGSGGPGPGSAGLGFEKQFPSPDGFRRGSYDYRSSLGFEGRGPPESSLKRKYSDEEERRDRRDDFVRQQVLQYGNPNPNPNPNFVDSGRGGMDDLRVLKQMKGGGESYEDLPSRRGGLPGESDVGMKNLDVNPHALKRAFLQYSKSLNENAWQRKNYLEDGKDGPLQCLACGRDSKDFTDVHGLIMHAYNFQNTDLRADHLGLHKALCVLMGWNYVKAPENSKVYQSLSADDAVANREDLIIWPPVVVIHNTNSGRRKDGRMEGMGNKEMDNKLKELGFGGGKSKSMYGKEGHLGTTVVRFADNQSGLKEAERLTEFFEKDNHGRKGWAHAQALQSGKDDESNPYLVKADEKTGEKKRIFYGYLGTASDLDKVDFDTRKKAVIKGRSEFDPSD